MTAAEPDQGKTDEINLDSEQEFPVLDKEEVSQKKTKTDDAKNDEAEGKQKRNNPGKKTRAKRKRTRERNATGFIDNKLITDFLRANRPHLADETDFASCCETDEENTEEETLAAQEQPAEKVSEEIEEKTEGLEEQVLEENNLNGEKVVEEEMAKKDKNDSITSEGEWRKLETDGGWKSMEVNVQDEREEVKVLMLGGSNCENMDEFLTGDHEIKIKSTVLFEGGLKIAQTTDKLDEYGDEEKKKDIKYIVVHVGSADFPYGKFEDLELKLGQYLEQLMEMNRACINAYLIICGVPLRLQHYRSKVQEIINDQLQGFNIKLREIEDKSDRIKFCNTIPYLADKDGPCPALYRKKDTDPNGIHLNQEGKRELAKAITEEIKIIEKKRSEMQASKPGAQVMEPAVQEVTSRIRAAEAMTTGELDSSQPDNRHV